MEYNKSLLPQERPTYIGWPKHARGCTPDGEFVDFTVNLQSSDIDPVMDSIGAQTRELAYQVEHYPSPPSYSEHTAHIAGARALQGAF